MNILVLGRGKTGSLVAEVARQRGHSVHVVHAAENPQGKALTAARLANIDAVIDFTTPAAVIPNIEACIRAKRNIVVGTTGWYEDLSKVRKLVEDGGIGFLYASNFSVGVNLFFDVARAAAAALQHQYFGQIFERHHAQKKDAPSGTAVALQKVIKDASQTELEITSFREGDVVGMHEVVLGSPNDTIYLCHDAKSRRSFAEGAVRAAEWLAGKKGLFDFKDVWREL
ncbi:MAG TPA: dihydrodipicolinate reductase C-terminal domain-containing protein [Terriglobales bacterium]|jgi:4-hydroxy-tetrahydrodipicolinate reductase|nr:dihydrodipicolinate reductase C-terminal domain-containing protein [Terriglobales bacterium]